MCSNVGILDSYRNFIIKPNKISGCGVFFEIDLYLYMCESMKQLYTSITSASAQLHPQSFPSSPPIFLREIQVPNNTRFEAHPIEKALIRTEEKYKALFDSIDEGFCIIEMLFDRNERPVDYRFLEVNAAFERQTGIKNPMGKRMREIAPLHEEHWFEIYGKVAITGESVRFENQAKQLNHWYEVYAFRTGEPQQRQVAILFKDIDGRKTVDQLKDDFISIASHELRTPLTGIKGYTDLLKRELQKAASNGNALTLANKLSKQVNRLTNLVNNLLETTNISQGKLTLSKKWFDLNELVVECISQLQPIAPNRRLSLNLASFRPIFADRKRIAQVLTNIISNAIKYTETGGTIVVSTTKEETDHVKVTVHNLGVGVYQKYVGKVFDRFFRISNTEMPNHSGMGLGLYICAEIIKRHGGTIAMECSSDKDVIFSFTLPQEI